ncbi:hypothetical protein HOLleu_31235 [Holothuria leucospilota]|uniref:Uncharacterized protein n=1 Tax=Holothuria leucospilota TaxID=206669 RepID=A0A9Q0YPW4_HOLLE|nr:hypothetical protein HOLleu_31235 [Holothuria leucospilota]
MAGLNPRRISSRDATTFERLFHLPVHPGIPRSFAQVDKESCLNIPTILHRLKRSSRTATETRRVTDIVVVKRLIGTVIFSADNVEEDVT